MLVACRKRSVPIEDLRDAAERIERDLFQEFEEEVSTQAIGERVLKELESIDQVAYVRFASVYQEFGTIEDFLEVVDRVRGAERGVRRLALGVGPEGKA